mgnify:CR=1 FL=1
MMKIIRLKHILPILLLLFSFQGIGVAQDQYLLTEKTYKLLTAAQELMAAENYSKAESQLLALLKITKKGSYDRAVVQQTLAYVYSSTERYSKATKQFEQALNSGALPDEVSHPLRYNLAQLYIAEQRYKAGINLLKQWIQSEPSPPSSAHVLMATAYYYVNDFKGAVRHLTIAVQQEPEPQETWYQLLLSAHIEARQYRSAIKVLETLISDFPYQKNYWLQLSALYLQDKKEDSALAVKALMQRIELTDSRVLLSLVDMYRYLHIPYKAAQLLEKGMKTQLIASNQKNLNLLADCWIAARELEHAAVVLKTVAQQDNSGEAGLKYGRVLFDLQQWQQSSVILTQSLQKLSGKQVGSATLWLAKTQYYSGDYAKAKASFSRAAKYQQERQQAIQWLEYIEQQVQSETVEQEIMTISSS